MQLAPVVGAREPAVPAMPPSMEEGLPLQEQAVLSRLWEVAPAARAPKRQRGAGGTLESLHTGSGCTALLDVQSEYMLLHTVL